METFQFKGYTYQIHDLQSKAEFNHIYEDLLKKANKGRSIVKDLEKAYRIRQEKALYVIRYDEAKRALVPVRIAKESVDGFLMKDRYDTRDRVLQHGIGSEMSRHSREIYDTVEKKHQMWERQAAKSEEKKAEEAKQFAVDGTNFMEKMALHQQSMEQIKSFLLSADYKYKEDRDYKQRVDAVLDKIGTLYTGFSKAMGQINRDTARFLPNVQSIMPADINRSQPPPGFLRLLETYHFLKKFNEDVEREWVTLRDYGLDLHAVPYKVQELMDNMFHVIHNTKLLLVAVDKILYPEKMGAKRAADLEYGIHKFNEEVIRIFTQPKQGS